VRPPRAGLLSIVDEVMAGGLIAPAGAAPAMDPAAVEWAEEAEEGDEEIPDPVWQLLGVPAPGAVPVRPLRAVLGGCCRARVRPAVRQRSVAAPDPAACMLAAAALLCGISR
jgi:hypothetical protein